MFRTPQKQRTMLLRLVYFDFKFFNIALPLAERICEIIPIPLDLETIKAQLKTIKRSYTLIQASTLRSIAQWREVLQRLEEMLDLTYQYREHLWRYFQFFISFEFYPPVKQDVFFQSLVDVIRQINPLLSKTDSELDRIIMLTNQQEEPSEKVRQVFERTLKDSLEAIMAALEPIQFTGDQLKAKLQTLLLKSSLSDLYSDAYSQAARIIVMEKWCDELAKIAPEITVLQQNIETVLRIKQLLSCIKLQFFMRFYQDQSTHQAEIEQRMCALLFLFSPDPSLNAETTITHFMTQLSEQEQRVRETIDRLEQRCKQYTFKQDVISGTVRLWNENYYYAFAKDFFTLIEELTVADVFQGYPIMDVRLDDHYRQFFTALASGVLCMTDFYLYGQFGVAYVALNSFSQLLLSNYLLSLSSMLKIDEGRMLGQLSKIKWILGFGLHLNVFMALSNFSVERASILALSYILGTAARGLSSQVLDGIERHVFDMSDPVAVHTRRLFIQPWVKQLAYIVGYRLGGRAYHSTIGFFAPRPEASALLLDATLCAEHKNDCEKAALTALDLPSTATSQEIRGAWKKSIFKYHPDRMKYHPEAGLDRNAKRANDETTHINLAYQRLSEIRM